MLPTPTQKRTTTSITDPICSPSMSQCPAEQCGSDLFQEQVEYGDDVIIPLLVFRIHSAGERRFSGPGIQIFSPAAFLKCDEGVPSPYAVLKSIERPEPLNNVSAVDVGRHDDEVRSLRKLGVSSSADLDDDSGGFKDHFKQRVDCDCR